MKSLHFSAPVLLVAFLANAGWVHAQPLVGSLDVIAPYGVFSVDFVPSTSSTFGLNNSGQIAVNANDSSGAWHTGVWTPGGFTEIVNTLPDASGTVYSSGINDAGQVIGTVGGTGFVWSGGTMTEIVNPVGLGNVSPVAINNAGQVTSSVGTHLGTTLFKTTGGGTVILPADGDNDAGVSSINNSGQVAGWSHDSESGTTRATVWSDEGVASFIPTANPSGNAYANAINDNGVVVGSFINDFYTEHAFIWDGSSVVDIGELVDSPFQSSVAYDVNAQGQVVGVAYGAFLYTDGVVYNLEELAAGFLVEEGTTSGFVALSVAYDINDLGQILGSGSYYDSVTDMTYDMAFLLSLSAVPEPSAAAALAGLAALGAVVVRRRRRA